MWGASARAHVHASFARWCLHARSSIADQGVILVALSKKNTCRLYLLIYLLRAEREARSEFFCGLREKSRYARPDPTRPNPTQPDPTQPDPVTLLRSLYLWNGLTDSRAVFFARCHHSINFVFDQHRYPPVPATAHGTCRGEGVGDTLSIGNSKTAGPIAFKFGVCLETS